MAPKKTAEEKKAAEDSSKVTASETKEEKPKPKEAAPDTAKDDKAEKKEAVAEKVEAKEEPAPKKELEEDAHEDSRPRLGAAVGISDVDCTADCSVSQEGSLISSLGSGGLKHLVSGARATVGAKAGRYYFDMRVLDHKSNGSHCRIGFSLADSSLFLGDNSCRGRCFFESAPKWNNAVIGCLLNLDEASPNAFTYSLFLNGARSSPPKPLSDALKEAVKGGAGLFPTVSFTDVTLACNFGQVGGCLKALPFKVRLFGDIAKADAVASPNKAPKDGCQVVVPVGLPEGGLFDWADKFLEEHPDYVELSDRSLTKWCKRSGLRGHQQFDSRGAQSSLQTLARFQKRNFLVLEAKNNLMKEARSELLSRFAAPRFKKIAVIAVGEPKADHKDWVHKTIKQRHEDKKARMAAKGRGKGNKGNKNKDADKEEDAPAAEEKTIDIPEPEVGPNVWFLPTSSPDVSKEQVAKSFEKFEFPTKAEGFDKVTYAWLDESKAAEHLKTWQRQRKAMEVVADLKPSDWFKEKLKEFQEKRKEYKKNQADFEPKKKEKKAELVDFEDKELAGCDDVNDCGSGIPVYANFEREDWVLLNWKFELHLLASGFKHDVLDPDRPGLPEEHIAHYYKLYLGQSYHAQALGCKNLAGVVDMLPDAVKLSGDAQKILEPVLGEELDLAKLVIMTEEARRDRTRRIEAGDESCILRIPKGGAGQAHHGKKGSSGKGGAGKRHGHNGNKGGGKAVKRPVSAISHEGRPAKFPRTAAPTRSPMAPWAHGGGGAGSKGKGGSKHSGGSGPKGKGHGKNFHSSKGHKGDGPRHHRR